MKLKFTLLLLLFCSLAQAQIVNIPDAAFKNLLLTAATNNSITITKITPGEVVDANNDGEIQVSEALTVREISIQVAGEGPLGILTFEGIKEFQNLKKLDLSSAQLINTSLDVSGLIQLESVDIMDGDFSLLNFSGCTGITRLIATGVNLPVGIGLNLSGLVNLNELWAFDTNITGELNLTNCFRLEWLRFELTKYNSIVLTGCTGLTRIDGSSFKISSIDISDCVNIEIVRLSALLAPGLVSLTLSNHPFLEELQISEYIAGSIDLSGCPSLKIFNAAYCGFSLLDFSQNPLLENLRLQDNYNLEYINLKNGNATYAFFNVRNNNFQPLKFVCIDEGEESYLAATIAETSGLNVNTYCSFTPGGNYNTITGTLTLDHDNDGCDATDQVNKFIKVKINDGTNNGYTFTNSLGQYTFYTQAGNFTITPEFETGWFTATPLSSSAGFANNNNNTVTRDFCVTAVGVHPDAEVVLMPVGIANPGFDAQYKIVFKNKGNQVLSGSVAFNYDDAVFDFLEAVPAQSSAATGSITWNYTGLLPFETREIVVNLNLNGPTEIPAVNIDDVLVYSVNITPLAGDETPADNTFTFNQTVTGSYDPNDITCLEGAVLPSSEIGEYLHYLVNFENTGTGATSFVVVKHDINPADFDISTLELLSASHPSETRVTGNRIEFIFDGLVLNAAEHGNILFKIRSKNNLVTGDNVVNNANIYFDYNFPVQTNDAATVFQVLSKGDFKTDNTVNLYPNPSGRTVNITADSDIISVELYDIQGRLLQSVKGNVQLLDVSQRTSGLYFVKVKTAKGVKVEKLIKE